MVRWGLAVLIPVGVLVALWLGWMDWLVEDGGAVRSAVEGMSWIAALVGVAFSWRELRKQRQERHALAAWQSDGVYVGRALHLVGDQLPKVADVSLLALRVKRAIGTTRDDGRDLPRYLSRDRDEDLEWAITSGGLVLLHGRAAAGKSRAAAEALRRLRPEHDLLVPVDGPSLRKIVESRNQLSHTVVWLDDLERFLVPDGLDTLLLQRLCTEGLSVVVVSTIRDNELAAYRMPEGAINRTAAEIIMAIPPGHLIAIEQNLSTAEQERAKKVEEADPRISRALAAHEGFAVYLAAGTPMMQRWAVGDGPLFHVGQALISAAVDCRRAGYPQPVPSSTLIELYRGYLPVAWRDRADLPVATDGLIWAGQPVLGASSCLQPRAEGRFLASDYLLDRAQEGDSPLGGAPVPNLIWETVFELSGDQDVAAVGYEAYEASRFEFAEKCFRRAGAAGDATAPGMVAIAIAQLGRFDEAKKIFLDAAERDDHDVMLRAALGLTLAGRPADLCDLARRAVEMSHKQALIVLTASLGSAKHIDDLYSLALFAVERDDEQSVNVISTALVEYKIGDRIPELASRAIVDGKAASIAPLVVYLSEVSTIVSLFQVVVNERRREFLTVIFAWFKNYNKLDRFGAIVEIAMDSDWESAILGVASILWQDEKVESIIYLAKEAICAEEIDKLRSLATPLFIYGRLDLVNDLQRYAVGVGKSVSVTALEIMVENSRDIPRPIDSD